MDTVPDTPRCLHGDLQIGNIITDGKRDDEATKRLLPYYATKNPYMFDMAFNAPMPDAALQRMVKLF